MESITLDELKDKVYGYKGTPERDAYEKEFELFLIGETIKQARKKKQLTQEQLGELIGVKKSRISKIESGKNLSFDAFLRIFRAMGIGVKLQLENMGEMELC